MKTKLFFIALCLMLGVFNLQANVKVKDVKAISGNSLSEFGSYTIESAEIPMVIDGQELKTYELFYENTENPIQIGVLPEKKCTNFILKTDLFEIEYVCAKNFFGVKKVDRNYASISKNMNEAVLDKDGYSSQKVISKTSKTEDELLGLIACYFPSLIKEKYKTKF